jgi:Restriction Enzyme Adenine Methylase Associated
MLLLDRRRFIQAPFTNESELEAVLLENYEYIFGPDSILLPKKLIRSPDGAGTIPDAFAIDLQQRKWYLVEAELLGHGVWAHIAPQVAKQIVASIQPSTRATLEQALVDLYLSDESVRDKFDEHSIQQIDVRAEVNKILSQQPIVAIPIDTISRDLKLWADQQRAEVRLWEIRKLVDFDNPSQIAYEIPDEFTPSVDTAPDGDGKSKYTVYEVTLVDLIGAGLLHAGQELSMKYKPRGGEQRIYHSIVSEDGSIEFMGQIYSSPSYAAIRGINDAGSNRKTVNGWTSWVVADGRTLADLRSVFLATNQPEAI